ncbi:MAG TPA: hypothetical protein EYH31_13535 [Anaerolineae bacterium]|nr:hypothetical protein [Anaerolineae bacterium]
MTSTQQRQNRYRIYTHITRSAILHVEDALEVGKLRLLLFQYRRGEGAQANASHYLDVEDARVLCFDLAQGHLPERFLDYKGSPTARNGKPLSRVLKVEDRGQRARNPIVIQISNGPGERVGEGAIKPAGKPDVELAILLSRWQARRLALAVQAHLNAWEIVTFRQRTTSTPQSYVRESQDPADLYELSSDPDNEQPATSNE